MTERLCAKTKRAQRCCAPGARAAEQDGGRTQTGFGQFGDFGFMTAGAVATSATTATDAVKASDAMNADTAQSWGHTSAICTHGMYRIWRLREMPT